MRIDNEFTVQAPLETVWNHLLDVEKVAPCMPGAKLTEVVDERTYRGTTSVKVGPVNLTFAGTVVVEERDDAAHRVVLMAQGMEQKGKGAATASVVSRLDAVESGTKVVMETHLTITGAVAQYGRGMMLDISQRLARQFAQCLEENIEAQGVAIEAAAAQLAEAGLPPPAAPSPVPPVGPAAAEPVKGMRLGLWALWRAIGRLIRRLFGAREV
jgi:carbon monoxide dehydrogenase subunit G